jgi:hypothetical protein
MKIFVAGTLLRNQLPQPLLARLLRAYTELQEYAGSRKFEIKLPLVEDKLSKMSREQVLSEVERRISESDSVVTVLYPWNDAVAFEADKAAKLDKPQAIIVSQEGAEKLPPEMRRLVHGSIEDVSWEKVIKALEIEVAKKILAKNSPPRKTRLSGPGQG